MPEDNAGFLLGQLGDLLPAEQALRSLSAGHLTVDLLRLEDRRVRVSVLDQILRDLDTVANGLIRIRGPIFIEGPVDLSYLTVHQAIEIDMGVFEVGMALRHTRLRSLVVSSSTFRAPLHAESAATDGDLTFTGCTFDRGAFLAGATIGGTLSLQASQFRTESKEPCCRGGYAFGPLCLNMGRVGGSAFFDGVSIEGGEMDAEGLVTRGSVVFSAATCANPGKDAITLDGAEIGGDLYFDKGFTSEGEVRLLGSKISGQLWFSDSTFRNPGSDAVSGHGSDITSDVYLDGTSTFEGAVDFSRATFRSQLLIENVTFDNRGGVGFEIPGATARMFRWNGATVQPGTAVSLADASVEIFIDDGKGWPEAGRLDIGGFRYRRFGRSVKGRSVSDRLSWIELDREYRPGNYDQLAGVLVEEGAEAEAVRVLIAKERRRKRSLPSWRRPIHAVWGAVAGYGYQPWRTGLGFLVAFVAGALAFGAVAFEPVQSAASGQLFNPAVYALDLLIPVVDLDLARAWRPEAEWAQGLRWILIVTGWVVALALAGSAAAVFARSERG